MKPSTSVHFTIKNPTEGSNGHPQPGSPGPARHTVGGQHRQWWAGIPAAKTLINHTPLIWAPCSVLKRSESL